MSIVQRTTGPISPRTVDEVRKAPPAGSPAQSPATPTGAVSSSVQVGDSLGAELSRGQKVVAGIAANDHGVGRREVGGAVEGLDALVRLASRVPPRAGADTAASGEVDLEVGSDLASTVSVSAATFQNAFAGEDAEEQAALTGVVAALEAALHAEAQGTFLDKQALRRVGRLAVHAALASIPEDAAKIDRLQFGLPLEGLAEHTSALGIDLSADPALTSQLEDRWRDYLGSIQLAGTLDVNALVQQVLRESYQETTEDLRFYAEKVRFYNECKKQIRQELSRARELLAQVAGKPEDAALPAPFNPKDVVTDFVGQPIDPVNTDAADDIATTQAVDPTTTEAYQVAQAKYDGELAEWLAMPGKVKTFNPEAFEVKQDFGGKPLDGPGVPHQASSTVDAFIGELKAFWGTLTPKQQEAYLAHFEKHPFKVKAKGSDLDDDDKGPDKKHNKNWTLKVEMQADEGFAAFVDRLSDDLKAQLTTKLGTLDPGDESIAFVRLKFDPPSIKAEVPPPKPKSLLLAEDELLAAGGKITKTDYDPSDAPLDKPAFDGATGDTTGGPVDTKAELEAYIKNQEERLNSVGDDAQLANVDLQNILQKQQQTLQMMSNISKMMHDTALAVIRKLGA